MVRRLAALAVFATASSRPTSRVVATPRYRDPLATRVVATSRCLPPPPVSEAAVLEPGLRSVAALRCQMQFQSSAQPLDATLVLMSGIPVGKVAVMVTAMALLPQPQGMLAMQVCGKGAPEKTAQV